MINQKRLIDTFTRLVETDSPSLGERQVADYLTRELEALGFSVTEDDAGERLGGNCGNLHAWLDGTLDLPPLLFSGHMDTVEPSRGKRAVVHPDGRITSDGTTVLGADDFAGVAAILEAARTIRERGLPHRPIEVLFTVAEELYCLGMLKFDVSALRSKECYVLDLSGPVGTAALRAPTILSFTVNITGKAAHAGFAPEQGVHAIRAAALGISRLALGRVEGDMTVNVGLIEGGAGTNIVPESCTVHGEIRGFDHKGVLAHLEEVSRCFLLAAGEVGAKAELVSGSTHTAYEMPADHSTVERFRSACAEAGLPCRLVSTYGGSDYNVLYDRGLRGLVIASAMEGCHSVDEYTSTDELTRAARLALALMTSRD